MPEPETIRLDVSGPMAADREAGRERNGAGGGEAAAARDRRGDEVGVKSLIRGSGPS